MRSIPIMLAILAVPICEKAAFAAINSQSSILVNLGPVAINQRFTSSTVTFNWSPGGQYTDLYWLDVGNTVGMGDIFASPLSATSQTVYGIPTDGRTIYIRLWTRKSGVWQTPPFDYAYQAQ